MDAWGPPRGAVAVRRLHPTTSDELTYTDAESEWLRAVDEWKRAHHVRFPTLKELFSVMTRLGYRKAEEDPWEAVPLVRWTADDRGLVAVHSRFWTALTDQPLAEALGYGWSGKVAAADRPGYVRRWQSCVDHGEALDAYCRIRACDGDPRWFLNRATPRVEAGRVVAWAGCSVEVDALARLGDLEARLLRHR